MRHIRIKLIPLEWQSSILIGIRMTRKRKQRDSHSQDDSHRPTYFQDKLLVLPDYFHKNTVVKNLYNQSGKFTCGLLDGINKSTKRHVSNNIAIVIGDNTHTKNISRKSLSFRLLPVSALYIANINLITNIFSR